MDKASILNKQVKNFTVVKVLAILCAILSLSSATVFAAKNTTDIVVKNITKVQEEPWKIWRSDNVIKISYRASNIKNLIEIKAQANLESTISGFIYFIEDLQKISNWLDNVKSAEMIRQFAANEHVFITRFRGLWPVSARNLVVHSRYWQNEDLSVEIAINDASHTIAQIQNSIRMQVISAHWHITPTKPNHLAISYQFIVDPKGNIPLWLTKPITLNGIWSTLNNIREQLPDSKWQQYTKDNIQELHQ